MLDDIFLDVSGHRRGDGLEFYHALVLLLRVLVVTEGRPGKSLEFYYALVLFLVLLVVTEVRHGKILDTRLPLQRSVHTGTWKGINIIQGDSGRARIAPKPKRQPCRITPPDPNRF